MIRALDQATAIRCDGCGAAIRRTDGGRASWCLYCRSPLLVETAAGEEPIAVLPFSVGRDQVVADVRRRLRSLWLSPERFRRADVTEVRGVYVPMVLGSATMHASYRALVRRADVQMGIGPWVEMTGRWSGRVDELWLTASRAVSRADFHSVRPFDLGALRRWDPRLVGGWEREETAISSADAVARIDADLRAAVRASVSAHLVGDERQGLHVDIEFERRDATLVLVPIWVLSVRYSERRPAARVLVNGQSGLAAIAAPSSRIKQVSLAFLALLVFALIQVAVGVG